MYLELRMIDKGLHNKAMQIDAVRAVVCMNVRASHFIMQTAIAYSATDGGVMPKKVCSTHMLVELN